MSLHYQYSWSYRAGNLKFSMADSSTTAARIRILFCGDCCARRQLHAGIKNVPTPSILTELLSALNVVHGEEMGGNSEACI